MSIKNCSEKNHSKVENINLYLSDIKNLIRLYDNINYIETIVNSGYIENNINNRKDYSITKKNENVKTDKLSFSKIFHDNKIFNKNNFIEELSQVMTQFFYENLILIVLLNQKITLKYDLCDIHILNHVIDVKLENSINKNVMKNLKKKVYVIL